MNYALYIAENCHECAEVLKAVEEHGFDVSIFNVDKENVKTPIPVFAFPALFHDVVLLRYGSDIIKFLSESKQKKAAN